MADIVAIVVPRPPVRDKGPGPARARLMAELAAAGVPLVVAPDLGAGVQEALRRNPRALLWMDGRVRFRHPGWAAALGRALERWPLVQPYEFVLRPAVPGGAPQRRTGTIQGILDTGRLVVSRPLRTLAWAVRSEVVRELGLHPACAGPLGELATLAAAFDHAGNPSRNPLWRMVGTHMRTSREQWETLESWMERFGARVEGRVGTSPGGLEVLFAPRRGRARGTEKSVSLPVTEVKPFDDRTPGRRPPRVFQIGFNKCGTTSLHAFFEDNGLRGVHYADGRLAIDFMQNLQQGRKVLEGSFEDRDTYTDMFYLGPRVLLEPYKHFDVIDLQYPGSKFILNVRDREAWVRSRSRHPRFEERFMRLTGLTAPEVHDLWRREWDLHLARVHEYFRYRPQDLLIFDIDSDPPGKIVSFLSAHYRLEERWWGHRNRTPGPPA